MATCLGSWLPISPMAASISSSLLWFVSLLCFHGFHSLDRCSLCLTNAKICMSGFVWMWLWLCILISSTRLTVNWTLNFSYSGLCECDCDFLIFLWWLISQSHITSFGRSWWFLCEWSVSSPIAMPCYYWPLLVKFLNNAASLRLRTTLIWKCA